MVQLKPKFNLGVEKKKKSNVAGSGPNGDLFIVGPWVKKVGGNDLES